MLRQKKHQDTLVISFPRFLSEFLPFLACTPIHSSPGLFSVLQFWSLAFTPCLTTDPWILLFYLKIVSTFFRTLSHLRHHQPLFFPVSVIPLVPSLISRPLLAALSWRICHVVCLLNKLSLTTNVSILSNPIYIASILSPTGLRPFSIVILEGFLSFFFLLLERG